MDESKFLKNVMIIFAIEALLSVVSSGYVDYYFKMSFFVLMVLIALLKMFYSESYKSFVSGKKNISGFIFYWMSVVGTGSLSFSIVFDFIKLMTIL